MDTLTLTPPKSRRMVVRRARDLPTVAVSKSRLSTCPPPPYRVFPCHFSWAFSSWLLTTIESGSARPGVICPRTDYSSHLRALYTIDIIIRLFFSFPELLSIQCREKHLRNTPILVLCQSGIRWPESASSDGRERTSPSIASGAVSDAVHAD